MTTPRDEDEFWQVALLDASDRRPAVRRDDDTDATSEGGCDTTGLPSHTTTVRLEFPDFPPLSLSLSSLPLNDGVWSPLGAQAWYGSALLASILLSPSPGPSNPVHGPSIRIQQHLQAQPHVSALELGSGAVGLSGFALGWMLTHRTRNVPGERCDCVVLTDNDPDVLRQLQLNVSCNIKNMRKSILNAWKRLPEYRVETLDWKHGYNSNILHDPSDSLQLVIGSELIYTLETAKACAQVVKSILKHNANALVVIVQVADRDGWSNVFVPTMRETEGVAVEEMPLTDALLHENASRLVRHGGTLDRFDFTICLISKE